MKEILLNSYEKKSTVPAIIGILGKAVGSRKAISTAAIHEKLKKQNIVTYPDRIRAIVRYIQRNDMVLGIITGQDWYYIAETEREMEEYAAALREYEDNYRQVRIIVERQRAKMWQGRTGQQRLF